MVFSALSLVMMLFVGTQFDEISRYILSVIFVLVALLVMRYHFGYTTRNFFIISLIGFLPYLLWYTLDVHSPPHVRYNPLDLIKIALPFGAVVYGLDLAFVTLRNNRQ